MANLRVGQELSKDAEPGMMFLRFPNGVRVNLPDGIEVQVKEFRQKAMNLKTGCWSYDPNSELFLKAKELSELPPIARLEQRGTLPIVLGDEVEFLSRVSWYAFTQTSQRDLMENGFVIGARFALTVVKVYSDKIKRDIHRFAFEKLR